jgi:hypothetical protein
MSPPPTQDDHPAVISHKLTMITSPSGLIVRLLVPVPRISKTIIDPVRCELQAYVSFEFEPKIPLYEIMPEDHSIQRTGLRPKSKVWCAEYEVGILFDRPLKATPNGILTG